MLNATLGAFLLTLCSAHLRAEEPSALDAAVAIEHVLIDAIARSEKSVVAIARVAHRDREPGSATLRIDDLPNFIGPNQNPALTPADQDFIPTAFATGVVIDRSGLVLTNHHVLALDEPSDFFVVTSGRKVFKAEIRAADPRSDLGLLAVTDRQAPRTEFQPISMGNAETLRKGQIVIALGNPYGIARDGEASASWGIVANLQRKAPSVPGETETARRRPTLHHYGTLIQTDAKLNLGTSGGALLNLKGEMIGLTTSLAAVAGFDQAAGYAIPVDDTFRRVLGTLKEGREVEYGLLGVRFSLASTEDVRGARVDELVPAGPANEADIRPNDLITHLNGTEVRNSDELTVLLASLPVAQPVEVTIEREGQRIKSKVALAKYPIQPGQVVTTPLPAWRGLTVDYATALNNFRGRPSLDETMVNARVMVRGVIKDSPAWQAGLREGVVISHVDSKRIDNPAEFRKLVATKPGEVVLRLMTQGGQTSTIKVSAQ